MEGTTNERVEMQEIHFGGERAFSTLRPNSMAQIAWTIRPELVSLQSLLLE
jgi:hypothetical protein